MISSQQITLVSGGELAAGIIASICMGTLIIKYQRWNKVTGVCFTLYIVSLLPTFVFDNRKVGLRHIWGTRLACHRSSSLRACSFPHEGSILESKRERRTLRSGRTRNNQSDSEKLLGEIGSHLADVGYFANQNLCRGPVGRVSLPSPSQAHRDPKLGAGTMPSRA